MYSQIVETIPRKHHPRMWSSDAHGRYSARIFRVADIRSCGCSIRICGEYVEDESFRHNHLPQHQALVQGHKSLKFTDVTGRRESAPLKDLSTAIN